MPDPLANGWGGARNRADRTSEQLTEGQVELVTGGALQSCLVQLPINRHITVQFAKMGLPEPVTLAEVSLILKKSGDWIAENGGQFTAIWSREVGPGKGAPRRAETACSELYVVNLWKVASYLAKGSSPALVAAYGLTHD